MSPMRDDGAWSLAVVLPPAMRNILRVWQLETRNLAGSVYPASTVAMVQVRAALADLGIETPPVEVQRTGAHAALDSAPRCATQRAIGSTTARLASARRSGAKSTANRSVTSPSARSVAG